MEKEYVYDTCFVRIRSEIIEESFEEFAGRDYWKNLLKSYEYQKEIDELFQIDKVQFLLLSGPYGTGKTVLVKSLIKELLQHEYMAFNIDLGQIPLEKLFDFFDKFMDETIPEKPCVLLLDNIKMLNSEDLIYALKEWEHPLLILGIEENLENICPNIRNYFDIFQIGLPDEKDREAFFNQYMNTIASSYLPDDMNKLVEKTKGYNYLELRCVAKQIALQLKYRVRCHQIPLENAYGFLDSSVVEEVLHRIQKKEKDTKDSSLDMQELLQILSQQQMMQAQQVLFESSMVQKDSSIKVKTIQSNPEELPEDLDDWLEGMDNFSKSVKK